MRQSADNPENRDLRVYDIETGGLIHGVQWFDDATGEYCQSAADPATGGYRAEVGASGYREIVSEIKRGGIVVRSLVDPSREMRFP